MGIEEYVRWELPILKSIVRHYVSLWNLDRQAIELYTVEHYAAFLRSYYNSYIKK